MSIFEWDEHFETGIESIDDQHKLLVKHINQFHDSMMDGQGSATVGVTLEKIIAYASFHFDHEEKLFNQTNFPLTEEHKIQHQKLVEQISSFKTKHNNGDNGISVELMQFLKRWLVDHILEEDMKYVETFKKNKVP